VQTKPSEESFALSRRENLLFNLLQLLNTADYPQFEERELRLQSLTTTSAVYEIGDLGLVPQSSSVMKVEPSPIYSVGSGFMSKPSLKADLSEVKMKLSGSTVSTMSTVLASESSSTVKSSKSSSSSSSGTSVSKLPKSSVTESAKMTKDRVIKKVATVEEEESPETEIGAVSAEEEQILEMEVGAVPEEKDEQLSVVSAEKVEVLSVVSGEKVDMEEPIKDETEVLQQEIEITDELAALGRNCSTIIS
ncbi:hypothetical protein L9F63_001386, partial [Diploptera punctata]